jgi:uncharacterized protein YuzE
MKTMEFEYDRKVDAAYVYLVYPIKDGRAKVQRSLDENITLDFDSKGKLLGVEILNASKVLSKEALIAAKSAI